MATEPAVPIWLSCAMCMSNSGAFGHFEKMSFLWTGKKLMDTSVDQLFKDREEAQQAPILEETTSGTLLASRPEKKSFSIVLLRFVMRIVCNFLL
jgi:hypothetical protein